MADRVYVRTDKNGTKYFNDYTCPRCGGAGGSDKWQFTGWTCYECGGSGRGVKPQVIKEYTPEYRAKLDAAAAKRHEKRVAKARQENIERNSIYSRVKTHTNPYGKPTLDYESGVKVLDMIKQEPAADVVEVRHGEWIYHECVSSYDGAISGYSCSECCMFVDEEVFDSDAFHKNFCGHCGAKMDGERKEQA